jgi:hypothetical protein
VDNFSVNPETRAGDPFFAFGVVEAKLDECPHGCIDGVVFLGHLVDGAETGEEVEVIDRVECKRCRKA